MAISDEIEYESIEHLWLDPKNPRLGQEIVQSKLSQPELLDVMKDWSLEEIAVSFAESGYWVQEAVVAVEEKIDSAKHLVVVEGNRRLAALKLLAQARAGDAAPSRWKEIARAIPAGRWKKLEERVPFIRADSRADVDAFLGFRHVTGIKEWDPPQKAEFIAHLIDDLGLDYDAVRRRIGSKTPTVRQNYIAHRILRQMSDVEEISLKHVEERFSVLYLSLRTAGVQTYLAVDTEASVAKAKAPVPRSKRKQLINFARWLFGDDETEPVVTDSRQIDVFGSVLESTAATDYLERNPRPSLEMAARMAGRDEVETSKHIERAADEVELALGSAHRHKTSKRMHSAVERLGRDTFQLLEVFPSVRKVLGDARAS